MRKVVVTEFLSLDGIMEEPRWTFKYWNDQIADFKFKELFASDAQLLGRVTAEGFAQAWPSQKDEQGFADKFNSMPKYVVSTTLDKLDWNNCHIIKGNVAEEVTKLKNQPGENILVNGSAKLVQELIKDNLIDEYHFLVYPLTLGEGKRIFQDGAKTNLKLVETKSFSSGVILMVYQTEQPDAQG